MKMTFDAEVGAAYIQFVPKMGTVADSWPLDGPVAGLDVIIDLDQEHKVLGVELLGRIGEGPEPILEAVASGAGAEALDAEGFDVPALRGNPEITIQFLGCPSSPLQAGERSRAMSINPASTWVAGR